MTRQTLNIATTTRDQRAGYGQRPEAATDPRLNWWRTARYGMFIHWGLYAMPHTCWQAYPDTVCHHWTGEWVQHVKRIPHADYRAWAATFDPFGFDAAQWVGLAKRAGMRYLVITAKHHDGFCLFRTATDSFNIVDDTRFGRDVIGELADECRRQGIVFGVYYSQTQDWSQPNGWGNAWDFDPAAVDFQAYLDTTVKPHLRELLTNYGPLGVVWFDTPQIMTREQSLDLREHVRSLQPQCLVSGRIGHDVGDFGSFRDNRLPSGEVAGDGESCLTMNRSWGYVAEDTGWKSSRELLWTLNDVVSKGGNVLVNVGPDGLGLIPDGSQRPLLEVGSWLTINGTGIYGTRPGPVQGNNNLRCTRGADGTLYLHVITWPRLGLLRLPLADLTTTTVRTMAGTPVPTRVENDQLVIDLGQRTSPALPHTLVIPPMATGT